MRVHVGPGHERPLRRLVRGGAPGERRRAGWSCTTRSRAGAGRSGRRVRALLPRALRLPGRVVLGGQAGAAAHPRLCVAGGEWVIPIADGDGAPVVSGGLVVWAQSWTGPFVATRDPGRGQLAGLRLADQRQAHGPRALRPHARVGAGGATRAAPAWWSAVRRRRRRPADRRLRHHRPGRPFLRRQDRRVGRDDGRRQPRDGARVRAPATPFVVAAVDGAVTEVAVSGDTVAWIQHAAGSCTRSS